jgi:hypothetical protein
MPPPPVWEGPSREPVIGATTALGADLPAGVRRGQPCGREAKITFKALIKEVNLWFVKHFLLVCGSRRAV